MLSSSTPSIPAAEYTTIDIERAHPVLGSLFLLGFHSFIVYSFLLDQLVLETSIWMFNSCSTIYNCPSSIICTTHSRLFNAKTILLEEYAGKTPNIYVNSVIVHRWIKKKTGGEPSEQEKRNVTMKLCELNNFLPSFLYTRLAPYQCKPIFFHAAIKTFI